MRIVVLNIPFKAPWLGDNKWITVPPRGYGGIQWVVKNLIDGLLSEGHHVTLLGAPGSVSHHENYTVVHIGEIDEINRWLDRHVHDYDLIHDHSCRGEQFSGNINWGNWQRLHTHHLSSRPKETECITFLSTAHARSLQYDDAPIVRIPINPGNYRYSSEKDDYFLYLGRISKWKGVDVAAEFAAKIGKKLYVGGPAWEQEYFESIMTRYKGTVHYLGEVHGEARLSLLSRAKAALVFSQSVAGPSGDIWVEPGATVVSESAVSGTMVLGSRNGCLGEIVPIVGAVIDQFASMNRGEILDIIDSVPGPSRIREQCLAHWHFQKIAREYIDIYERLGDARSGDGNARV